MTALVRAGVSLDEGTGHDTRPAVQFITSGISGCLDSTSSCPVASALQLGCSLFLSFDERPPPVPDRVQVWVHRGGATLTSWSFDQLREILERNASMSIAFHAALARAIATKLVDSHEPLALYRQMLQVRSYVHRVDESGF